MSVARNILKHPKLVPGGGATELTVSATLKAKSSSIEGIEKASSLSLCFFNFNNYFYIGLVLISFYFYFY